MRGHACLHPSRTGKDAFPRNDAVAPSAAAASVTVFGVCFSTSPPTLSVTGLYGFCECDRREIVSHCFNVRSPDSRKTSFPRYVQILIIVKDISVMVSV